MEGRRDAHAFAFRPRFPFALAVSGFDGRGIWSPRCGKGLFRWLDDAWVVEGTVPIFFVSTYDAPDDAGVAATGSYNLDVVAEMRRQQRTDTETLYIILCWGNFGDKASGIKSKLKDFYAVSLSTRYQRWRVEIHREGKFTTLVEKSDWRLKPNFPHRVHVEVRGAAVSVACNDLAIFDNVQTEHFLTGPLGVGVYQSRAQIPVWTVLAVAEDADDASMQPALAGSNNAVPLSGVRAAAKKSALVQYSRDLQKDSDNPPPPTVNLSYGSPSKEAWEPAKAVVRDSGGGGGSASAASSPRGGGGGGAAGSSSSAAAASAAAPSAASRARSAVGSNRVKKKPGLPAAARGRASAGGKGKGKGKSKSKPAVEFTDFEECDTAIVESIKRDILSAKVDVAWEDIAGNEEAKRILNEAILLPMLMPEYFQGIRAPWKGILLFGPPGTGKTLLAKAVASTGGTTFFNVSAGTLVSKFHGESEKLVTMLFKIARALAPSTIFIDECDALFSARGGASEHEASRRLKSTMLTLMDGVDTSEEGGQVTVIASCNFPWDLDEAFRRRLAKRVYIALPDEAARRVMFERKLSQVKIADTVDYDDLAAATDGYSGADIESVCRDAAMMPLRRWRQQYSIREIKRLHDLKQLPDGELSLDDFRQALKNVRSSVGKDKLEKYEKWEANFGAS